MHATAHTTGSTPQPGTQGQGTGGARGPAGIGPSKLGKRQRSPSPNIRGGGTLGGHRSERRTPSVQTPTPEGDDSSRQGTGSGTSRLHEAAICGLLWHAECQALEGSPAASAQAQPQQPQQTTTGSQPLPDAEVQQQQGQQQALPGVFKSAQQYVQVFEPLLHEEARGSLVNSWEELAGGETTTPCGWKVTVSDVSQQGHGWFTATLTPEGGRGAGHGGGRGRGRGGGGRGHAPQPVREKCVVILSKAIDKTVANGTPQKPRGGGSRKRLMRIAGIVKSGSARAGDPMIVTLHPVCPHHDTQDWEAPCMQGMRELLDHGHNWHVISLGPLTTHERECEALTRVLQGSDGPMSTLLPMLLDPASAATRCQGQLAQVWPDDFASHELMRKFHGWLSNTYDLPQREALLIATSHLSLPQQLQQAPIPVLPFTLIQGPPGTGKTHTVKGILNMWHVISYQRYYATWCEQAVDELRSLQATCAAWDRDQQALELINTLHMRLPDGASRPRVLVCAPSNAATDELCERILKEGFRDLNLNVTFPDVARVGSEDAAMSEAVKDVWIEARVRWYMALDQPTFAHEFNRADVREKQATSAMKSLLGKLDHHATQGKEGFMQLAGRLVDLQSARHRAELDMNRLRVVAPVIAKHRVNERQIREELELSLMEAAELVFTTLSSTGRNIFSKFKKPFDAVLIDEACQAAEVAALQPLVHGTTKVVLVGDPKQLPATIFSRGAKETAMERSLFERMAQAGVPVKLLSVQYRMHPEIRAFPSAYFYDNQLQDAPQVVNAPPAPFYKSNLLKPYVVFNVEHGQEGTGRGGRSRCNAAEARLCAGLFWELRCELEAAVKQAMSDNKPYPPRVEVGVVTPYRSQRDLLRSTFSELLGPDVLQDVRIETVDSFQGKQLDVIILSCVRAFATPDGPGGRSHSIGFLSDTRRLNVAITRAKQALWVVGHVASLSHHNVWKALLLDADARGCMVHDANADNAELLPHFNQLIASKVHQQPPRPPAAHQPNGAPRDPRLRPPPAVAATEAELPQPVAVSGAAPMLDYGADDNDMTEQHPGVDVPMLLQQQQQQQGLDVFMQHQEPAGARTGAVLEYGADEEEDGEVHVPNTPPASVQPAVADHLPQQQTTPEHGQPAQQGAADAAKQQAAMLADLLMGVESDDGPVDPRKRARLEADGKFGPSQMYGEVAPTAHQQPANVLPQHPMASGQQYLLPPMQALQIHQAVTQQPQSMYQPLVLPPAAAPQDAVGAAWQGFGVTPGYGAPAQGYGAPTQDFMPPPHGYEAPAPWHGQNAQPPIGGLPPAASAPQYQASYALPHHRTRPAVGVQLPASFMASSQAGPSTSTAPTTGRLHAGPPADPRRRPS